MLIGKGRDCKKRKSYSDSYTSVFGAGKSLVGIRTERQVYVYGRGAGFRTGGGRNENPCSGRDASLEEL